MKIGSGTDGTGSWACLNDSEKKEGEGNGREDQETGRKGTGKYSD
jgi:hypothetical protein